jgi:hypothetical protein
LGRRGAIATACALVGLAVAAPSALAAPANDNFASAQVIGGSTDFDVLGSNVLATKEPGEPNHAGDPGGASVWFRWTAPQSDPVILSTCNPPQDGSIGALTLLAVYTGAAVNALTPVASNDNGPGAPTCGNFLSLLKFQAVAGTSYLIAVDGETRGGVFLPSEGSFNLHLSLPLGPNPASGSSSKKCKKKSKRAATAKKKCKKHKKR